MSQKPATLKCDCGETIDLGAGVIFQVTYCDSSALNHTTIVCPFCNHSYDVFDVILPDWFEHLSGMPLATILETSPSRETIESFQRQCRLTPSQAAEIMDLREYLREHEVFASQFAA